MKKKVLVLAFLVLAVPMAASADTITYVGHSPYGVDGFMVTYNSTAYPVARWAGERIVTGIGGSPDEVLAYCLDVFTPARTTPQDAAVRPIGQMADGSGTGSVPTNAQAGAGIRVGQLFTLYAASVVDSTTAAALQLAIWEVIFETDLSSGFALGSGSFVVSGDQAALGMATTWAASLAGFSNTPSTGWWIDGVSQGDGRSQDFGVPAQVPEPTSLALLGFGLFTLGIAVRRRRKQA